MDFSIFLISIILVVFLAIFVVLKKEERKKEQEVAWKFLKEDIESLKRTFGENIAKLTGELGRLKEIGRSLQSFQNFLRSPKVRGGVGEQLLKNLLEEVLPKDVFKLQYRFETGEMVDAAIKIKQGIIPIDSKFPLESFQKYFEANDEEKEVLKKEFVREIKKRIEDISRKYILPAQGTIDYAIMYVPAESVFLEITLNHPEIIQFANEKKVILLSPNTFYYFLKVLLVALEGIRIEETAKRVLENLKAIEQESLKFAKEFSVFINHVENVKKASERLKLQYQKLVNRIDGLKMLKEEKGQEKLPIEEKTYVSSD